MVDNGGAELKSDVDGELTAGPGSSFIDCTKKRVVLIKLC
jgi:hypothetical protein